ncbi:uncharacterized protein LOC125064450 [Vanessa atalanta]|uniref:uncharacterized protein LOC125064450 n=1 Tax=Vanessa atalanta TaxID=42275 RepID=UPI001FCDDF75|nr:uncharacterized protein LOC125064450 [Vanessa atalanta]
MISCFRVSRRPGATSPSKVAGNHSGFSVCRLKDYVGGAEAVGPPRVGAGSGVSGVQAGDAPSAGVKCTAGPRRRALRDAPPPATCAPLSVNSHYQIPFRYKLHNSGLNCMIRYCLNLSSLFLISLNQ